MSDQGVVELRFSSAELLSRLLEPVQRVLRLACADLGLTQTAAIGSAAIGSEAEAGTAPARNAALGASVAAPAALHGLGESGPSREIDPTGAASRSSRATARIRIRPYPSGSMVERSHEPSDRGAPAMLDPLSASAAGSILDTWPALPHALQAQSATAPLPSPSDNTVGGHVRAAIAPSRSSQPHRNDHRETSLRTLGREAERDSSVQRDRAVTSTIAEASNARGPRIRLRPWGQTGLDATIKSLPSGEPSSSPPREHAASTSRPEEISVTTHRPRELGASANELRERVMTSTGRAEPARGSSVAREVSPTTSKPPVLDARASQPLALDATASQPPVLDATASQPLALDATASQPLALDVTANQPPVLDATASQPPALDATASRSLALDVTANQRSELASASSRAREASSIASRSLALGLPAHRPPVLGAAATLRPDLTLASSHSHESSSTARHRPVLDATASQSSGSGIAASQPPALTSTASMANRVASTHMPSRQSSPAEAPEISTSVPLESLGPSGVSTSIAATSVASVPPVTSVVDLPLAQSDARASSSVPIIPAGLDSRHGPSLALPVVLVTATADAGSEPHQAPREPFGSYPTPFRASLVEGQAHRPTSGERLDRPHGQRHPELAGSSDSSSRMPVRAPSTVEHDARVTSAREPTSTTDPLPDHAAPAALHAPAPSTRPLHELHASTSPRRAFVAVTRVRDERAIPASEPQAIVPSLEDAEPSSRTPVVRFVPSGDTTSRAATSAAAGAFTSSVVRPSMPSNYAPAQPHASTGLAHREPLQPPISSVPDPTSSAPIGEHVLASIIAAAARRQGIDV
jgi:hypothetical protein